jgi:hypothetical protein
VNLSTVLVKQTTHFINFSPTANLPTPSGVSEYGNAVPPACHLMSIRRQAASWWLNLQTCASGAFQSVITQPDVLLFLFAPIKCHQVSLSNLRQQRRLLCPFQALGSCVSDRQQSTPPAAGQPTIKGQRKHASANVGCSLLKMTKRTTRTPTGQSSSTKFNRSS